MRILSVLLFIAFLSSSSAFDFSSFSDLFDKIKTKIQTLTNGNSTEVDLSEMLSGDFNKTLFHEKLQAIRDQLRNDLNGTSPKDQKMIEQMLKRFAHRVITHIRKTGDHVNEVNEKLNLTGNFYQGDMILTPEQMEHLHPTNDKKKRQAMSTGYSGRTWTTFYYSYASSLSAHAKVVSDLAIKFWQDNTCLNFVQSTTASPRVNFFTGQGCYSYVGNIGRSVQELSLGQGCDSVGTAAHEIGHAMGFWHEQSRHDRDNAITLMPANVASGWLDQFDKESTSTNNNYGHPYDYGSIMQYAGLSASGNRQPTMIAKTAAYQDTMGSDIVSFIDVSMMNDLYKCKARCPAATSAKCLNSGFPHPRDCTKCLCPAGYGGNLCDERPSGCGAILTATTTAQTLTTTVGQGTFTEKDSFVFCNWIIKAPSGKKVEATITKYANNACTSGCVYGGVELKWLADKTQTGSRYCCTSDVNEKVTSASNEMPIIGFNRYGRESFTISYRAV